MYQLQNKLNWDRIKTLNEIKQFKLDLLTKRILINPFLGSEHIQKELTKINELNELSTTYTISSCTCRW